MGYYDGKESGITQADRLTRRGFVDDALVLVRHVDDMTKFIYELFRFQLVTGAVFYINDNDMKNARGIKGLSASVIEAYVHLLAYGNTAPPSIILPITVRQKSALVFVSCHVMMMWLC